MDNMMNFGDMTFLALGWLGLYGSVALAAIGSMIGCTIAGQAACGAMMEVESGYGKFIGLTALPSSQAIYGVVIALTMNTAVQNAGGLSTEVAPAFFAVGLLAGIAMLYSALKQGQCIAAAVKVSKTKPEVFGLSIAPAGIVEGFALFAFIVALIVAGNFAG